MNHWQRELDAALDAAKQAGELAALHQRGIEAETKADLSPVTVADRECEKLISSILSGAFAEDGLLGEEGANRPGNNGRKWIIDPIDGTRDYVRGNPFWATLIGLEVDGEVRVGVAGFPGLGLVYTAVEGAGAFCNGQPIHVSSKSDPSEAVLCLNGFNKLGHTAFRSRLLDWMGGFWAVRSFGGGPDAMYIANGQADVWIEPTAAPWDLAPLKIIIEEAGGRFFNLDGGRSIYGGNCVACAPGLEAEVRRFVGLG